MMLILDFMKIQLDEKSLVGTNTRRDGQDDT